MASGLFFLSERRACSAPSGISGLQQPFIYYSSTGLRWILPGVLILHLHFNFWICNTASQSNPTTLCLHFYEFGWTVPSCFQSEIPANLKGRRGQHGAASGCSNLSLRTAAWLGSLQTVFLSQGWKSRKEMRSFKSLLSGLISTVSNCTEPVNHFILCYFNSYVIGTFLILVLVNFKLSCADNIWGFILSEF